MRGGVSFEFWLGLRGVEAGALHHEALIVDGGPNVVSFVIDGRLRDGGEALRTAEVIGPFRAGVR